MSGYAFQGFNMEQLDDENSTYTVFVPTQEAVEGVLELMNLNMWDGLNFSDMVPALNYHIVPGIWMAADLEDGMSLLTLEGQSLILTLIMNSIRAPSGALFVRFVTPALF